MTCDLWEGYTNDRGYPQFKIGKRTVYAHRLVWMQDHGHTDLFICHTCDTPNCIAIDHLFAGTAADNIADMVAKGRHSSQRKTECPRGHTLDDAYISKRGNGRTFRACRTCRRERYRERRAA